jgi:DNA-binding NtrC family response regulator
VRGAFTGATLDRAGVFDEADGGTLFLDEIGELRPALQPALLRALDRGEIRPVGQTKYHKVDVRIVAATHRNLSGMIRDKAFREDLYYRLAVVRLTVAPLRDRPEDIPLLVRHFLRRQGRPDLVVPKRALEELAQRPWRGNVRELRNVVERALVLARNGPFTLEAPPKPASGSRAAGPAAERRPFQEAKAEAVTEFERSYLAALTGTYPTLTEAARAAEMDRKHLRTLLRRYGYRDD